MPTSEAQREWVQRVLHVQGAPADAASGGRALSLVRLGKARIEWIGVRRGAVADIGRLREAIAAEFASDHEQTAQLATALGTLDGLIAKLDEKLETQLDGLLNEAGAGKPPPVAAAKSMLSGVMALLDQDPVMAEIDGNEVLPDLAVRGPLKAKLAEISAALG